VAKLDNVQYVVGPWTGTWHSASHGVSGGSRWYKRNGWICGLDQIGGRGESGA